MDWYASLIPHIPLRILPSHFYFAFQGQRSCYSSLYQASLDLLRAARDIDALASANGSLSAHLLPALPAHTVVVVPDHQSALLDPHGHSLASPPAFQVPCMAAGSW